MFGTFVKYQFQRTYDAILAAPVDTEELVTAEALWIDARRRLRLRADARRDGLRARPELGHARRAVHRLPRRLRLGVLRDHDRRLRLTSIDNFNYVVSAVLTPLFLVAGTFFPLNRLPRWAQIAGEFNPLHHCVELVRHAVFGFDGWTDLARVGALVVFGLIVWRIAIHAMERKLVDWPRAST